MLSSSNPLLFRHFRHNSFCISHFYNFFTFFRQFTLLASFPPEKSFVTFILPFILPFSFDNIFLPQFNHFPLNHFFWQSFTTVHSPSYTSIPFRQSFSHLFSALLVSLLLFWHSFLVSSFFLIRRFSFDSLDLRQFTPFLDSSLLFWHFFYNCLFFHLLPFSFDSIFLQ